MVIPTVRRKPVPTIPRPRPRPGTRPWPLA